MRRPLCERLLRYADKPREQHRGAALMQPLQRKVELKPDASSTLADRFTLRHPSGTPSPEWKPDTYSALWSELLFAVPAIARATHGSERALSRSIGQLAAHSADSNSHSRDTCILSIRPHSRH